MGSSHSSQRHERDGPLFGGHYPGDFSIRNNKSDYNKPLPALPERKSVRFGSDPPAWKFYKNRPADENLANTRYCPPPPPHPVSNRSDSISPPPAYGKWDEKSFTIRNQ
ncbi:uncharacterized protein IL334_002933 [Kwoniella shivajii]|uniref:Uncharacterized protein n=1 Tax=Kwoniella shivajii TaxID=564305 RepID=A0ABZ1D0A1_9TREE|nr:hypothetical protein IL334_002933 [Kwoniella shivajii]